LRGPLREKIENAGENGRILVHPAGCEHIARSMKMEQTILGDSKKDRGGPPAPGKSLDNYKVKRRHPTVGSVFFNLRSMIGIVYRKGPSGGAPVNQFRAND